MKYIKSKELENEATKLLESLDAFNIPVRIDVVAHRLGLYIDEIPLDDEVSGILVVEDNQGTIGVNKFHSEVRRRFTIAHEIAHYILHRDKSELFIDKKYTAFRNADSSSGEMRIEIQANQFAASLLMPAILLKKEVAKLDDLDLGDDLALRRLAQKFDVSLQAMAYRLSNLGIFISDG